MTERPVVAKTVVTVTDDNGLVRRVTTEEFTDDAGLAHLVSHKEKTFTTRPPAASAHGHYLLEVEHSATKNGRRIGIPEVSTHSAHAHGIADLQSHILASSSKLGHEWADAVDPQAKKA